jgi:hypothetical protein
MLMASRPGANVGCQLVAEYVDEAEIPADLAPGTNGPVPSGQVVRPRVVADYLDQWAPDEGAKDFVVLLRDSRAVTVRGHGLKYVENPSNPADFGSYAVLGRSAGEEVVVALFRVSEVTGIFNGDLRPSSGSA